jgi:hypothetical protein
MYGSQSKKVRKGYQYDSQSNKQNNVGHEIRKDHQQQAANQRHNRPLLFAVNEKPQTY